MKSTSINVHDVRRIEIVGPKRAEGWNFSTYDIDLVHPDGSKTSVTAFTQFDVAEKKFGTSLSIKTEEEVNA